jgi:O-antigen/teichoic acid export membrane protein
MLLIAPTSHHRILFQCGDKEHIVRMSNRYAIAGLACVALAMVGALMFVAVALIGSAFAAVVGSVAGLVALWCWYLQPLRRRRALHRREEAERLRPAATLRAAGR